MDAVISEEQTTEVVIAKIKEILERAGIEASLEREEHPEVASFYINIVTPDAGLLIGAGAENLLALEHLIKRMTEKETKDAERPRFFLDINGYRLHAIDALKEEAKQVAKKVRLYRKELVLKPMSAFERRIIHIALAEYPDITTESIGEGERRRVVIKPYP